MRPEAAAGNARLQLGVRSTPPLQNGQLVQARVVKALTQSKWLLAIHGKTYPATSNVPVRVGDILAARVELQAGRIFLHLTNAETARQSTPILERLGLPQDDRAAQLLRAFFREGLAIDPERFTRIHRHAARLGLEQPQDLRLLIVLDRKGLSELLDLWSELQHLVLPRRDQQQDSEQRKRRNPHRGRAAEAGDGADAAEAVESVEHRAEVAELSSTLRSQFTRAHGEPPGRAGAALQIFNHVKHSTARGGEEGHWIAVPLRIERGELRYTGVARVLLKPRGSFSRATVELQGERRRWGVEWWNGRSGTRKIALYVDDPQLVAGFDAETEAAWRTLSERLADEGVSEIGITGFPKGFDGFSSDGDDYIIGSVAEKL